MHIRTANGTAYCQQCKQQKKIMSNERQRCLECFRKNHQAEIEVAANVEMKNEIKAARKRGETMPWDVKELDELTQEESWQRFLEKGFC